MAVPINFVRVGLSLPCEVPVLPGSPDVDAPPDQRTEKCHVDAWWITGLVPTCDVHLRVVCKVAEIDFDDLVKEAGGLNETEQKPWAERYRYPQTEPPLPNKKEST
jgi:hypothetical protein